MGQQRRGRLATVIVLGVAMGALTRPMSPQTVVAGSEPAHVEATAPAATAAGTLVLSGTMSSRATITMTGAFSVGHASSLTWNLPLPRTLHLNGYTEIVAATSYRFSLSPSWTRVGKVGGNPVTIAYWSTPPARSVIRVTEQIHATVRSTLRRFQSRARFPLAPLPPEVRLSTRITPYLFLYRHGRGLARRLSQGRHTEQGVVEAMANWVASHLHYAADGDRRGTSAAWVLHHPGTTCAGYANVMASLLRYQGIPVRVEYGWVSSAPITLRGAHGASSTIQWGDAGTQGAMHAWLHIYFPGAGWVPFDPQHEKFFIDPRHFGFAGYADAGSPRLGTWTATVPDGQSATGAPLANGSAEIVPGDGVGSRITVAGIHDTFHATMNGMRHDVRGVLLLSR